MRNTHNMQRIHVSMNATESKETARIDRMMDPAMSYTASTAALQSAIALINSRQARVAKMIDNFYDTRDRSLLRSGHFLLTRTTMCPPAAQWYLFTASASIDSPDVAYTCIEGEVAVTEALRRMWTPHRLPVFPQMDIHGPRAFAPHLMAHIDTTSVRLSPEARLHVAAWAMGGQQGIYGMLSATEGEALRLHGRDDGADRLRALTPIFPFLAHTAPDVLVLWSRWLRAQSPMAFERFAWRLGMSPPIVDAAHNIFHDICSFPDWLEEDADDWLQVEMSETLLEEGN